MYRKLFRSSVLLVMVLLLSNATANVCDAQSAPCANQCICQGVSAAQLLDQYINKKPDVQVFELPTSCLKTCWYWGQGNRFPTQKDWAEQCVKMYQDSCAACQKQLTPQATSTVIKPTATVARVTPTLPRTLTFTSTKIAPTHTSAPTITPTLGPWDLSVQKIVALQAVEGGRFVLRKPAAVRVFLTWPDPATSIEANVELLLNGETIGRKTQKVKNQYNALEVSKLQNSFNFFVPADKFKQGTNTFTARAVLNMIHVEQQEIKDPNPANNQRSLNVNAEMTRGISVLIVSTHKDIDVKEVSGFLAEAYPYINAVYPMQVNIPPYFYRSENIYFDTAIHNVIALEEARQLYNSQTGKIASYAVGLYPANYYGADIHGMSFWWNRRSVLVEVTSPESMPHEIGHGLGGSDEYSKTEPGKLLPPVNIYRSNVRSLEDLSAKAAAGYINFMGNAGKTPPTWVDADMWNLLVDKFNMSVGYRPVNGLAMILPQADDQKVDGYLIKGVIGKDDSIQVAPPMWLQNLSPYPNIGESDYVLSIADHKGIETVRVPIYVDLKESDPAPFVTVLPAPRDMNTIFLRHNGKLLGKWTRSANAPQVKIVAPTVSGNNVTLTWQASDADNDALTYTVLFSHDNGETWLTAATNLKDTSLTLDTATMPGCDRCLIRVITTDGWNTNIANIPTTFTVENKIPSVVINSPKEGEKLLLFSLPITFDSVAYDLEEGLLDGANIVWRSDRDGDLGTGSKIEVPKLSLGTHKITVSAQDSYGGKNQSTINVTVGYDTAPEEPSLFSEEGVALWWLMGGGLLTVLCLSGIGVIVISGLIFLRRR